MENPSSPLDTLRQLKEMLDAGALTPTEFEALKQRLVFTPAAPGAAGTAPAATPGSPAAPATPVAPLVPVAEVPANAPAVLLPTPPAFSVPAPADSLPPTHEVEVDALVFQPVPEPMFMPEASVDFPITVGGPSYVEEEALADENSANLPAAPAQRNSSLGLVLAIGAVLVFLAVVAYLGFTRPTTDEHISSISQTAADSLNNAIETGPQVAPLPATAAAPETVRVAPTNPAPVIQPRPAVPAADSVARATNSPASDSAGSH